MRWDRKGDTEENSKKKSEENVICSKCTRSIVPIVGSIIIDVIPSSTISNIYILWILQQEPPVKRQMERGGIRIMEKMRHKYVGKIVLKT